MISKSHNLLIKDFENKLDNISEDPDAYFVIFNGLNDYTVDLINDYKA